MVNSQKRKTGRPRGYFTDRHGNKIDGLIRLKDGRWRISGPDKHTYTERDEDLAIAYFHQWQARKNGTKLSIPIAAAKSGNPDSVRRAVESVSSLSGAETAQSAFDQFCREFLPHEHPVGGKTPIRIELVNDRLELFGHPVNADAFWPWLRRLIIEKPAYVAQMTGIEQIGWLGDLKRPAPIPSLDELDRVWAEYFKSSAEQKRKCKAAFDDFRQVTGIKSIKEITPEVVVAYRDDVYSRNLSGKSQSNLFTRLRRYFSFFKNRAMAIDEINKVLGYLALLKPNETTVSLDPKPIEPADFKALLKVATGDDRAMLLMMMNCAMYLAEVVNVRWDEIKDACFIGHRSKTGKCVRVAVLWPETIEALKAVKRRGPYVFVNYAGAQLGIKGAERRFRALRDAAKLPHVTSSMLRDGAYTACVEANVTDKLCKLLVGHRSGLQDNYVKRKPTMVAPACEAVRQTYMAPKTK